MDNPRIRLYKENTNIIKAKQNALIYYNEPIYLSTRKDKKFVIQNPSNGHYIHFGNINYKDYLKTNDEMKRKAYLARSAGIRGNWKNNDYSPNNLSRRILWNAEN